MVNTTYYPGLGREYRYVDDMCEVVMGPYVGPHRCHSPQTSFQCYLKIVPNHMLLHTRYYRTHTHDKHKFINYYFKKSYSAFYKKKIKLNF